ncbi:MAG: site-specific integrase, partial [Ruminococcus sp.]|nr:site-specific integrase [Ruminococcus sp.]
MNAKDKKPKKKVKLDYGEGSIYYVKSRNRYAGQVNLIIEGQPERWTVYGKTEREVKNKLMELQVQAKAGNLEPKKKPQIVTIYDLAEKMIGDQLALNEIRQSSYDRKMATLKMLEGISDQLLVEVTEDDLIEYFKSVLNYSQSCVNKIYQLLGAVFLKAINKNIIEINPLRNIRRPKSKQRKIPVRALTVAEQGKLLNVLKTEDVRYSEIMLLSMFTGMRIGEVCALTVEDINFNDNTINVSKTVSRGEYGKTIICDTKTSAGMRTLHINHDLAEFLRTCIGEKDFGLLFKSGNNKLVTTNQVNYVYAKVLKDHNIVDNSVYGKVDLHSLRHTYATRCIEAGMPAKVLQQILGHTDISITLDVYCSVFKKYSDEHLAVADEY